MRAIPLLAVLAITASAVADDSGNRSPEHMVLDEFLGSWDIDLTANPPGGDGVQSRVESHRTLSRGGYLLFDDPNEPGLHISMTYDTERNSYVGVMLAGTTRGILSASWDATTRTMHFVIENQDDGTTYRGTHRFVRDGYAEVAGRITNAEGEVLVELSMQQTRRPMD